MKTATSAIVSSSQKKNQETVAEVAVFIIGMGWKNKTPITPGPP
jgi:hypothetical protein